MFFHKIKHNIYMNIEVIILKKKRQYYIYIYIINMKNLMNNLENTII